MSIPHIVERDAEILFLSSLSLGEFAEVFKGLFEDSIVAVKILKVCCECVYFVIIGLVLVLILMKLPPFVLIKQLPIDYLEISIA